jgi:hypothetical protein
VDSDRPVGLDRYDMLQLMSSRLDALQYEVITAGENRATDDMHVGVGGRVD